MLFNLNNSIKLIIYRISQLWITTNAIKLSIVHRFTCVSLLSIILYIATPSRILFINSTTTYSHYQCIKYTYKFIYTTNTWRGQCLIYTREWGQRIQLLRWYASFIRDRSDRLAASLNLSIYNPPPFTLPIITHIH